MLRGLTVVAMIIFHTLFQLTVIFQQQLIISRWFWVISPILISGSFLLLVGLSLHIAHKRGKYNTPLQILKRSGSLFCLGMTITVITLLAQQHLYVYFGILHCISLTTLISYYTLAWSKYTHLLAGIIIISIGMAQQFLLLPPCNTVWTFFIWPSHSPLLRHLDYYPIIPAIGFVLIGIFVGKIGYKDGQRTFKLPISQHLLTYTFPIRWLGRHALLIYCIHTPIIFIAIYITRYLQQLLACNH